MVQSRSTKIISMIQWIQTSSLSIKNSHSGEAGKQHVDHRIREPGLHHHHVGQHQSLHPTPYTHTIRHTPYTPHPRLCTSDSSPSTLHPPPSTLHPIPCTLHPAPCTSHPAPPVHPIHPIHPTTQTSNPKFQPRNQVCAIAYKPSVGKYTGHTVTLNPQPSTLNPQPSTLDPQPSILNPQPSTLHSSPQTLNPSTLGTYTGHMVARIPSPR